MKTTTIFLQLLAFLEFYQNGSGDYSADSLNERSQLNRIKSAPRVKRIIGGSSYDNGQWPWLVSLRGEVPVKKWGWLTTSYKNYYCGGSLISNRFILTAAHCFVDAGAPKGILDPDNWHVKAGDVKRTLTGIMDRLRQFWYAVTNQNTASWWYVQAEKIIIHPQYNPNALWLNDLALVKLEDELDISSDDRNIGVVTLPTNVPEDWPPPGSNCSMQGWGCTYQGGPLQEYAREVILPVVNDNTCRQIFGNIAPTRFCAGFNLANKGICSGDSGGPLVCQDGTVWKQAGIASFAAGEQPGNWPGAFTRVTEYTTWIQSVINNS